MKAKAVSIIGGADGPTSIFLAGRNSRSKRSLKHRVKQYLYKVKRSRVEARIKAHPRTLQQVGKYIIQKYGARELSHDTRRYEEEYYCLKESLILRHQPELLEKDGEVKQPVVMDEAGLKKLWEQMEERSKRVRALPEEAFPVDFHVYSIRLPKKGEITVTIEKNWGILGCSYSGKPRAMKELGAISRRIYLYYGVSEEDIRQKTERYQSLVSALSS